jgi:hypothetical protein
MRARYEPAPSPVPIVRKRIIGNSDVEVGHHGRASYRLPKCTFVYHHQIVVDYRCFAKEALYGFGIQSSLFFVLVIAHISI